MKTARESEQELQAEWVNNKKDFVRTLMSRPADLLLYQHMRFVEKYEDAASTLCYLAKYIELSKSGIHGYFNQTNWLLIGQYISEFFESHELEEYNKSIDPLCQAMDTFENAVVEYCDILFGEPTENDIQSVIDHWIPNCSTDDPVTPEDLKREDLAEIWRARRLFYLELPLCEKQRAVSDEFEELYKKLGNKI